MSVTNQTIKCPACGHLILLSEVMAHQYDEEIKKAKLELWPKALEAAKKEQELSNQSLVQELQEKQLALKKAQELELTLRREKNKLAEDKANFELEKQRQLDADRLKIQQEATKKADEAQQYKLAQLEKKLSDALKANEEQKRKLEQGSQQTQGEVVELELEELLKTTFIYDQILPVPKGVSGADIVQKVHDKGGRVCGQIIWEIKKTKLWTEGWITKLKDDQRTIKADLAVIVSSALPDGVSGFALRDGVWVCELRLATALAGALRLQLESISREKSLSVGKNERLEVLYAYLTGVEFKQRVEAIVEAFSSMQQDLNKERLAYQNIWAKREAQIQRVINNTVGMYGDLSGLVSLPQIKLLELEEEK